MSDHDPDRINRLIGKFSDLQEQWQDDPDAFDWGALQALAKDGAQAYNEGSGPSFHALALDGVQHTQFHERFLAYALEGGLDPFKLSRVGNGTTEVPVIDHDYLAEAATFNPSSVRMRVTLTDIARSRFIPLVESIRSGGPEAEEHLRVIEACAESIPNEILEQVMPELVRPHEGEAPRDQTVDPIEGYLSSAESIVDRSSSPYG